MVTSTSTISWSDIDVNEFSVGSVKTSENKSRFVSLFHKEKQLIFQTPPMKTVFGVSKWENADGTNKYSIDLIIDSSDNLDGSDISDISDNNFCNTMYSIQDKIVDLALSNSSAWFKSRCSSYDVVEALFSKPVKTYKNKPCIRLQVPYNNKTNEFDCEIYNKEKELIEINQTNTRNSTIVAIVQCSSIWLMNGKFGVTMKALQLKVLDTDDNNYNRNTLPKQCLFADE